MPRDASPRALGEVALPADRRGRVVAADDAGEFRIEVCGADWIARLQGVAALDCDEVEAAQTIAVLFEESELRPRTVGGYDGVLIDSCDMPSHALEELTGKQLAAWRRLDRLLSGLPASERTAVEQTCLWDQPPTSVERLRCGLRAVAAQLGSRRAKNF